MAQYCRYCSHFCTGNGNYCEIKKTYPTDKQAKSPNKCKKFDLNPIDAFYENNKGYMPREPYKSRSQKEPVGQLSLFG